MDEKQYHPMLDGPAEPVGLSMDANGNRHSFQRGVIPLATPEIVPIEVATCPECGGRLIWQATSTDGLEDMILECQNESEAEEVTQDDWHRWWQSEWEPVINKVKAWVMKRYNDGAMPRRQTE